MRRTISRAGYALIAFGTCLCSSLASAQFANCPATGSCFTAHATPGCNDGSCCTAVCDLDAFCCNNQWDGICVNEANDLCVGNACEPACNKTNVECLNPGPEYKNSRFVARMSTGGFCTAWVIAAPNVMLTNNHCSATVGDTVQFDFECTECVGGSQKPVQTFTVTQVLDCNVAQDWCIFRVNGNVAALFGQAVIDPAPVAVGLDIYEIHHAEAELKGYDEGEVTALNQSPNCPGSIVEHAVSVIGSQGASGSPIFSKTNDCVVAVCNCGPPCSAGFALPMSAIWPTIKILLDNNGAGYLICGLEECATGNHSCFTTGGPGCDDLVCCTAVCLADPFCCNNSWDGICADEASDLCDGCGDPAGGDCFAEHDAYCDDEVCCESVCDVDSFCCDVSWDGLCVNEAYQICTSCGEPESGSCYETHGPTCDDDNCCADVCVLDPFCCETSWDNLCVNAAIEMCPACGNPSAGDCFVSHPTPYCADELCCDYVCSIDPFCCNTSWDSICANEAEDFCTPACGAPGIESCFVSHSDPFCNDDECCEFVCSIDPFCCDTAWDGICVNEANAECVPQCGAGLAGSCFVVHSNPFCDDAACCNAVCQIDAFCCQVIWDGLCASEAGDLCANCPPPSCPADLNLDNKVNSVDLGLFLGAWGTANRCADLDNNGIVGSADLGILLGEWGPC